MPTLLDCSIQERIRQAMFNIDMACFYLKKSNECLESILDDLQKEETDA
jgi:hypothetical protein